MNNISCLLLFWSEHSFCFLLVSSSSCFCNGKVNHSPSIIFNIGQKQYSFHFSNLFISKTVIFLAGTQIWILLFPLLRRNSRLQSHAAASSSQERMLFMELTSFIAWMFVSWILHKVVIISIYVFIGSKIIPYCMYKSKSNVVPWNYPLHLFHFLPLPLIPYIFYVYFPFYG